MFQGAKKAGPFVWFRRTSLVFFGHRLATVQRAALSSYFGVVWSALSRDPRTIENSMQQHFQDFFAFRLKTVVYFRVVWKMGAGGKWYFTQGRRSASLPEIV
jgi:hypothetical protein